MYYNTFTNETILMVCSDQILQQEPLESIMGPTRMAFLLLNINYINIIHCRPAIDR